MRGWVGVGTESLKKDAGGLTIQKITGIIAENLPRSLLQLGFSNLYHALTSFCHAIIALSALSNLENYIWISFQASAVEI